MFKLSSALPIKRIKNEWILIKKILGNSHSYLAENDYIFKKR